jgi:UDP-N-acetylglucosamine/UDP-N-acetylgalactosamine diphosphorylase
MSSNSSVESNEAIHKAWVDAGQAHVFAHLKELSESERASLFAQLKTINPALVTKQLAAARAVTPQEMSVKPYTSGKADEHVQLHWKLGLKAIGEGKVAALLLAGGQGTRLKTKSPKVALSDDVGYSGVE